MTEGGRMPKGIPPATGVVLDFFLFSRGINDSVFAERAGVTPLTVKRWRTGDSLLSREELTALLDVHLDIPAEADNAPHAEVEQAGVRLMWDCAPEYPPTPGGGSLAFLCASPAEEDAVHANLVSAGYTSERAPWDAEWGQRYAVVLDADGYHVDLFAWIK